MNRVVFQITQGLIFLTLLMLFGCGGGSSDSSNNNNPFSGSDRPDWTANVFEAETKFKDLCQNPRAGIDSFSGNAFTDKAGSTLLENHWLRSWSNNTYLWYDEINDNNPANFSATESYFEQLKTLAVTNSGQPKDKFHFTFDTAAWQQLNQSGISAGYGATWTILQSTPPRKVLVAFTEPSTPASNVNLERGAEILSVDGIDVVNASDQASIDILNAALFPSNTGEIHQFVIREAGAINGREITMTSQEITSSPVQNVASIDTENGKVGYLLFTSHIATAEEQLINAVTQLQADGINDLVLDLRYNGGGLLAIASQLAYMIAGDSPTNGQTFENLVFNDKHPVTNPVTGATLAPSPFYNTSLGFSVDQGQSLPTLNLSRVFILSTDRTCSASEAIINGLRGVDIDVILIGSTTCGKPYGFFPTDNCGTTYFSVQFRGENAKGFGDYSDGFSPLNTLGTAGELITGCSVADDFSNALGDPNEGLYKAALDFRTQGSCPTPSGKSVGLVQSQSSQGLSIKNPSPIENAILLEHRLSNQ